MSELYVGLMSGTSVDAIDAALVEIEADSVRLLASHSHAIPDAVRAAIICLCRPGPDEIIRLGMLDRTLGELFADATLTLLGKASIPAEAVRAIGSHGQTVRHHPDGPHGYSLQLGDANTIAIRTRIPVVADFRRKDIALGGQGAPLVPAFHNAVFRSPESDRAIVNIGGIANITVLPHDPAQRVYGYDIGPGNTLMDAWSFKHRGVMVDEDGAWGGSGNVLLNLLTRLIAEPYFLQRAPKSTGRELFNLDWLSRIIGEVGAQLRPEDVQATLQELTARTIADAVKQALPRGGGVFVCGGGVHNQALMARLRALLPEFGVAPTDALGVGADWVEAMAFAWLAQRHLFRLPGNLPEVTGARSPAILGGYYPV